MESTKKAGMNRVIKIRISNDELSALKECADTAGISVSEFLRKSGRGATITSSSDRQTVRELRRLGGLLKKVHIDSSGAYSAQTAAAINSIAAFIDGLTK